MSIFIITWNSNMDNAWNRKTEVHLRMYREETIIVYLLFCLCFSYTIYSSSAHDKSYINHVTFCKITKYPDFNSGRIYQKCSYYHHHIEGVICLAYDQIPRRTWVERPVTFPLLIPKPALGKFVGICWASIAYHFFTLL